MEELTVKSKSLLVIFILMVCTVLIAVGLIIWGTSFKSPPPIETYFEWKIVQSPITGRYYEIAELNSLLGMSEVTESEYNEYINERENER